MRSEKIPRSFCWCISSTSKALAIILALTVLAFSPVLTGAYIRLDDYANILDNPNVHHFSAAGLARIWTSSALGFYIPFTYSIWWLYAGVASLLGTLQQSASLFHALNLTVHALNVAVVFLFSRFLLRPLSTQKLGLSEWKMNGLCAVGAALFALHPAQVETVAWITELKGLIAWLLGLLGIWIYYRSHRRIPTAVLFLAAMLSKPSAIVFPGLLLLADRILLGRSIKDSARVPLLIGLLLLPLVIVTKHLQPDANLEFVPSFWGRLLVAADSFSFYCYTLLFPFRLALDYGRSPQFVLHHVPGWQIALSIALLFAGAALVAYSLARRWDPEHDVPTGAPFVLFGLSAFCLSLVPVLGIVPFAFQDFTTVADHYLYVPIWGASFMVLGLLIRLRGAVWSFSISAITLAALLVLTFSQASHWHSTESLFTHTLEINPRSYLAHYSIGADLLDSGRTDAGISHMLKCLEIRPGYLSGQIALGVALSRQGRVDQAIDHYLSFLATNPSTAGKRAEFISSIHNTLGALLCRAGREREGAEHFRKAVELNGRSIIGHLNLGQLALKEGDFSSAVAQYRAALVLDPDNREIQRLLAFSIRKLRRE